MLPVPVSTMRLPTDMTVQPVDSDMLPKRVLLHRRVPQSVVQNKSSLYSQSLHGQVKITDVNTTFTHPRRKMLSYTLHPYVTSWSTYTCWKSLILLLIAIYIQSYKPCDVFISCCGYSLSINTWHNIFLYFLSKALSNEICRFWNRSVLSEEDAQSDKLQRRISFNGRKRFIVSL